MDFNFPTQEDLLAARVRIAGMIHTTPVLTSRLLNALTGAELFFKCENFQRMGAFKMRGASNAILQMSEEQRSKGVITHSSGNFAQAVSLSASLVDCPALIVMPENAPAVKKAAVRGYGGQIIESSSSPRAREEMARKTVSDTNGSFIHPSDDIDVIVGNSTAAQELIEEVPNLDMILSPVGGGGLLAGTALAAKYFSSGTQVIGAEPSGADDAYRSLRDGKIHLSKHPDTICDGLRTNLGQWNFPIIQKLVKEILLVDDSATIEALKLIFERMKMVVEPSSAIVLAAVLSKPDFFQNKRIGCIISGGNIDTAILGNLFEKDD